MGRHAVWWIVALFGAMGCSGTSGGRPGDLVAGDRVEEWPTIQDDGGDDFRGLETGEAREDASADPHGGDPGWEVWRDALGDPASGDESEDPGPLFDPGDPGDATGDRETGGGDPAGDPAGDAGALTDADEGVGPEDPGFGDPGSGPWTVRVHPAVAEDVVASYLMAVNPSAWNLFGGEALPLGRHFDGEMGHVGYHSAIRFPGLPIPQGARILSATLSFLPTNEVDSSNILWLAIHGERSPDSAPFSLRDYDQGRPDQRLRTNAAIDQWVIRCNANCTDLSEYDCPQRKRDCWDRTVRYLCPKDLRALVQEVVDLPEWRAGNAFTVILQPNVPREYLERDTGARHIVGVEAGRALEDRPALEVTFTLP